MSHRLTISTQITDREAAQAALKQMGVAYDTRGDTIFLKAGNYNGTEINLKTGKVTSGDVDYNRGIDEGKLGLLRQYYAEAKYRAECLREGVEILDRQEVVENGQKVIVLRCQTA
jgi:hypothetical protein